MDTDELDRALRATLDDGRLSRAERQALGEVLKEGLPDQNRLSQLRARAFGMAAERITDPAALQTLGWLEELTKLLVQVDSRPALLGSRAYFSPGEACLNAILGLFARVQKTADICVFTVTDDRITEALLSAHRRGVALRVLTDNDKQFDHGSDIERLRSAGVEVRVDDTEHHMHHKFALFDGVTLLNGSYNWTRSAAAHNEENLIVTGEPVLIATFARQFESMWKDLAR